MRALRGGYGLLARSFSDNRRCFGEQWLKSRQVTGNYASIIEHESIERSSGSTLTCKRDRSPQVDERSFSLHRGVRRETKLAPACNDKRARKRLIEIMRRGEWTLLKNDLAS